MKIKCHNCGNESFVEQTTEDVFNVDGNLFLIKNIPSYICSRCGEKYLTPEIQQAIIELLRKKPQNIATIETQVIEFA